MDKSKIRAFFEYEFRGGTYASETARKINNVFGEGSISHSTVYHLDLQNSILGCLVLEAS